VTPEAVFRRKVRRAKAYVYPGSKDLVNAIAVVSGVVNNDPPSKIRANFREVFESPCQTNSKRYHKPTFPEPFHSHSQDSRNVANPSLARNGVSLSRFSPVDALSKSTPRQFRGLITTESEDFDTGPLAVNSNAHCSWNRVHNRIRG
jgi:hypothetical protein